MHGLMIGKYPLINNQGVVDDSKKLFYADTNGNLTLKGTIYATAGSFSGEVTALSGYIGQPSQGWTIISDAMYNGKPSFSSTASGIYIGTDGISLGTASNYIRANKNGYLLANNVNVSGHIEANSGVIGGCEISNGTLQVTNANIISINASKITAGTMSANRISGGTIDATDVTIKNLNASNITSGTINGNVISVTNLNASNIKSGTLNCNNITVTNLRADSITVGKINASQINGLPASQITSGQFTTSRIPELNCSKITSGTFDPVRIPNLSANKITTGTLSANRISGGTLSGISISIGGRFQVKSDGSIYIYGRAGKYTGWHYGITDAIPYMNNTIDQWLMYFFQGICIGYGNNK